MTWNYGSSQKILNKKLSYLVGVSHEKIIALSGAAQLYPVLKQIFINKKVALPDITFGEYPRLFPEAIKYRDFFENKKILMNV